MWRSSEKISCLCNASIYVAEDPWMLCRARQSLLIGQVWLLLCIASHVNSRSRQCIILLCFTYNLLSNLIVLEWQSCVHIEQGRECLSHVIHWKFLPLMQSLLLTCRHPTDSFLYYDSSAQACQGKHGLSACRKQYGLRLTKDVTAYKTMILCSTANKTISPRTSVSVKATHYIILVPGGTWTHLNSAYCITVTFKLWPVSLASRIYAETM